MDLWWALITVKNAFLAKSLTLEMPTKMGENLKSRGSISPSYFKKLMI